MGYMVVLSNLVDIPGVQIQVDNMEVHIVVPCIEIESLVGIIG